MNEEKLTWPLTIRQAIDNMFSHNSIVCLWYQYPKDEKGEYRKLYERTMAWDIPEEFLDCRINKVLGLVSESITKSDTINLLIQLTNKSQKNKCNERSQCSDAEISK